MYKYTWLQHFPARIYLKSLKQQNAFFPLLLQDCGNVILLLLLSFKAQIRCKLIAKIYFHIDKLIKQPKQ